MGDFLSKELTRTNKWWLPKYRYMELRYFALQYPEWRRQYAELSGSVGLASKRPEDLYLNGSKLSDRTAEIAIKKKLLFDYMRMVEQSAIESDPVLGPYVLASVTEGLTFVELKSMYDIPCERDMFYDRRRKFFWVLNGVR